jgi:xylulose-5-phosphate/fructose-6-phosphate phosphoketolase
MKRLFIQFSFIPSHLAPKTSGSIHDGGELRCAPSHRCRVAFDNPEFSVACVVGDGAVETGPLATRWHSYKFLNTRSTEADNV